MSLKTKETVSWLTIFTYLGKMDEILGKVPKIVNKNNANSSNIHKNINPDNSL